MASELNRPRVLVVDDEENIAFLVDAALRLEGIETQRVGNGYDAIAAVATFQPHAIVLDVMMPGIDGFETCRRLKRIEETRDVPVILVTALSDTADRLRGFAAGGVDYVTKPFRSEEILARAVVHADLTRARRRMRQAHALLAERAPALDEDSAVAGALELLKMG